MPQLTGKRLELAIKNLAELKSAIGKRVQVLEPDHNAPDEGILVSIHPNHPGCFLVRFDGDEFETAIFPEYLELIN